eukprot:3138945-Amphidinium_carterae.1
MPQCAGVFSNNGSGHCNHAASGSWRSETLNHATDFPFTFVAAASLLRLELSLAKCLRIIPDNACERQFWLGSCPRLKSFGSFPHPLSRSRKADDLENLIADSLSSVQTALEGEKKAMDSEAAP